MRRHKILIFSLLAMLLLCDCSGKGGWTVKGKISGAKGDTVVLEASNNGMWYALDSAVIGSNGKFSFTESPLGYPDIYRLNMQGKSVYFPIDSIETVILNANADDIEYDYTLSGSVLAETMMKADRKIMDVVKVKGEAAIVTDSILKRELSELILGDQSGIVAYYIINKRIGNTSLYNPIDKKDNRIIGAVANIFAQKRPNDPRTEYLKKYFLENKRLTDTARIERSDTAYVNETTLFDIKLYDNMGKMHSLKDVASKGNVTILNFTIYDAEKSPAFNMELAKIYEVRKAAGLEIYQVSADADEYTWKQSAKNLPWITVYNSPNDGTANLLNYNVNLLPTTYIIDRNGELVERVDDITQLNKLLDKYM